MISLDETIGSIQAVDAQAARQAQQLLDAKTKPRRSLGLLEDLACRIAAIMRSSDPEHAAQASDARSVLEPALVIMAADHGVAAEGVSAYPQEVTGQMIDNIASGGAASNVLARHVGARLMVIDMGSIRSANAATVAAGFSLRRMAGDTPQAKACGYGLGTRNFVHEPAMPRETAVCAIEFGIALARDLADDGVGLLAIGEMGIANTTSASALTAALTGLSPEEVTGRGTGIDDAARQRKADVIRRAIAKNHPNPDDPLDVLAKLGGFEIAGLVGVMLGAASKNTPIILDGFITGAAALVAVDLCPLLKDYLIASHTSAEPGHKIILRRLGLRPLLDLDMRLGEGTGALLAVPLVIGSLKILKEMATFAGAGVTDTGGVMHADWDIAALQLALAMLLDLILGEYPNFLHPVVWIGKTVKLLLLLAPRSGWWAQLLFGGLLVAVVCTLSGGAAIGITIWSKQNTILEIVIGAVLLKATFALAELGRAAFRVVKQLTEQNLGQARAALRSLCSRDPSEFQEKEVLEATVESLAENASDSFVAPLFYFLLFGLPGAVAYRAINTMDSMMGYRGKYEALGKTAARLDDVVNWIPARLTAALLMLVGGILGYDLAGGWRIMRRDGRKTPSPNGGRPMAAMAGLLGVRLEKKDVYALGDPVHELAPEMVRSAWRMVIGTAIAVLVLSFAAFAILYWRAEPRKRPEEATPAAYAAGSPMHLTNRSSNQ